MSEQNWFIDPGETVRLALDLPGDHWIEVKRELGFGEEAALQGAMMRRWGMDDPADGKNGKVRAEQTGISVDLERFAVLRIKTWVVDWSARGPNGKTIEVSMAAIKNLRPLFSEAITVALDKHVEEVEAGKAAARTGGS